MIWESEPWKQELRRTLARVDQRRRLEAVRPLRRFQSESRSLLIYEQSLFMSAFIIRKLSDSQRLSFQAERQMVSCSAYPARDRSRLPDSMNWERVDRFYDLDRPSLGRVPLRRLVNLLIHSYVFGITRNVGLDEYSSRPSPMTDFLVNSDQSRKELFRIGWHDYRIAAHRIVEDDVIALTTHRDGHGGETALRSAIKLEEVDWATIEEQEPDLLKELRKLPARSLHPALAEHFTRNPR